MGDGAGRPTAVIPGAGRETIGWDDDNGVNKSMEKDVDRKDLCLHTNANGRERRIGEGRGP